MLVDGIRTDSIDLWADYCAKSDALALLVLESHTQFSSEVQDLIAQKRLELDQILDTMIGGTCRKPKKSRNTGATRKRTCAKDV